MRESIRVGIIQTVLNHNDAWKSCKAPAPVVMGINEELRARTEIRLGLNALKNVQLDVLMIPELSVPHSELRTLHEFSCQEDCHVFAGIDYFNAARNSVANRAVLLSPQYWNTGRRSAKANEYWLNKNYPAPKERKDLHDAGYNIADTSEFYWFDIGALGSFGLCICYDLMDLQRATQYRGLVDHFLIVAYNKDFSTFLHLAEAYSRTVFCNVVICNTGYYGGSIVVSPHKREHLRAKFLHRGKELFVAQVVELDVRSLREHRTKVRENYKVWKALPPGV